MSPSPDNNPIQQQRTATCLETDEEVMQALRANFGGPAASGPAPLAATPGPALIPGMPIPVSGRMPGAPATSTNEVISRHSSARPFAPVSRPPTAILTVFDDGKQDGEQFRLRGGKFLIGRTEGHLKLLNDGQVSSKHVEIAPRDVASGKRQWVITDLNSTNGLYARVARALLPSGTEFIVGQGYYRLTCPTSGHLSTMEYQPAVPNRNATLAAGGNDGPALVLPTLYELVRGAVRGQMSLSRPEYWIGTDPNCAVGRPNDPYCEPRHARLFCDGQGNWNVENNMSLNGVWVRVPEIVAEGTAQFQIGEQRFKLQLGGAIAQDFRTAAGRTFTPQWPGRDRLRTDPGIGSRASDAAARDCKTFRRT